MEYQLKLAKAFELFEEHKVEEAKQMYDEVLEEVTSEKEEIFARMNYGYILVELKQFEEAIDNYERMQQLGEQTENQEIVSQSYHQLGMVYRLFEQYEKALEYFDKEKQMIQTYFQEDFLFLSANAYELGYNHLLLKNMEEAKKHLYESLTYAEQSDDPITLACSYRGLGEYYQKIEEVQTAREMYQNSKEVFESAEDTYGVKEVEKLLDTLPD